MIILLVCSASTERGRKVRKSRTRSRSLAMNLAEEKKRGRPARAADLRVRKREKVISSSPRLFSEKEREERGEREEGSSQAVGSSAIESRAHNSSVKEGGERGKGKESGGERKKKDKSFPLHLSATSRREGKKRFGNVLHYSC